MMKKKQAAHGIILLSVLWIALHCQKPPAPPQPVKEKTYVVQKLERYIKDEYLAEVFAKSKRPYLYAALASVESDFRPQIVGDNGESKGLFQIQSKWWGEVPSCPLEQLKKVEGILEPRIKRYGLDMAIMKHNGKGRATVIYLAKVKKRMKEIKEA